MKHIACAIFLRDQQILLGKRAAHKSVNPNCWDLIGGHVEFGETPEIAIVREAEEEVGLTPIRFERVGTTFQPNPGLHGEATFHLFTVLEWIGGEPQMLGKEHTEIGWFAIQEALALVPLARADYRALFGSLLTTGS